jgi:hypothetical protein
MLVHPSTLLLTADCEITIHIHLIILSNKNNTKQIFFKLNLGKIISMDPDSDLGPERRAQVCFGSLDERFRLNIRLDFSLSTKVNPNSNQAFSVQGAGFNQQIMEQKSPSYRKLSGGLSRHGSGGSFSSTRLNVSGSCFSFRPIHWFIV